MTPPLWAVAAKLSLPVFPCGPKKRPTCSNGFHDAQTEPRKIRDLFIAHPGTLIGVPTGEASNIDVLDIDKKHEVAVKWWLAHRDRVTRTRVHRTRSGGLHVLFLHRPGLRCWAGRPVMGIDGRGDGGYAIWWPAAGLPVLCEAGAVAWPKWLTAEVSPEGRANVSVLSQVSWHSAPRSAEPPNQPYVEAALASATERVSGAGEGARNSTLNAEAHGLARFIAAGALDGQRAADALAAAAIRAGLDPRETVATLRSAFRARDLA